MPYDRKDVTSPRLSGTPLKLFASLVGSPMAAPLRNQTFQQFGVESLRAFAVSSACAPRPPELEHPAAPATVRAGAEAVQFCAELPGPAGPYRGLMDYHTAYQSGRLTPNEVAERALEATAAADRLDKPLRWFVTQYASDVREQAEASTRRWAEGRPLSVFDGVPVAIKDVLRQRGYPTSVGTRFLAKAPETEDGVLVARFRAAGALMIGKTNLHEIGLGVTGINPHHGAVRNPYDTGHVSGGSSSGTASLVASGVSPVSHGTDGGGSVRIPAAFCGLVGLKTTTGRLPSTGSVPVCWSVAVHGLLGASARDVAAAYALIAGPDASDPVSSRAPAPHVSEVESRDLSGLRLGVCTPWFDDADPEVVAGCRQLVEGLGAEIVEIRVPDIRIARAAHMIVILTEMLASQHRHWGAHRRDYGLDVRVNLTLARSLTGYDYAHSLRLGQHFAREFSAVLSSVDAIVTPSTGCTAPPINEAALPQGESDLVLMEKIMRFATVSNLIGFPSIAVPAGYDRQGLPISAQFMAAPYREDLLLRIAHAADGLVERRRPVQFWDLVG